MDRRIDKSGAPFPDGLERLAPGKAGYETLVRHQGWRVAVITYAERFDKRALYRLERHLKTDEVFVLLGGEATLFIGTQGIPVRMRPQEVYNVKCGVWHGICVSWDAKVLICENEDTGADNTEYKEWVPLQANSTE